MSNDIVLSCNKLADPPLYTLFIALGQIPLESLDAGQCKYSNKIGWEMIMAAVHTSLSELKD